MRRTITILLVLCTLAAVVGCGKKVGIPKDAPTPTPPTPAGAAK